MEARRHGAVKFSETHARRATAILYHRPMRNALAVLALSFMPWIALAEESAISWGPGALQWVKSGTEAKAAIAKAQPAKNAKVDWSRVVSLSPESVTVMTSAGVKSLPIKVIPEADQLKLGLTPEVMEEFIEWKKTAKAKADEGAVLSALDESKSEFPDERIPAKIHLTQIVSDTEALCRVIPRVKATRKKPVERSALGGAVGGGGIEQVWRDGPMVDGWVIGDFKDRIDGEFLVGWVVPPTERIATRRSLAVLAQSRSFGSLRRFPKEKSNNLPFREDSDTVGLNFH